jgi:hypothetical protein
MKFWKSRLARLNDMFDSYIKENFKVVDYQVKSPSRREHNLTWRPYGYYKRRKSRIARNRCIAIKSTTTIEARSAMDKERRVRMEFDTDSFDILIDNCCSHTLTNDINDYIEPPVKSSVRVRGYNGSTNSTMVGTVKWKIKDDNGKTHNSYCQTHITHLQLKQGYYHHSIGRNKLRITTLCQMVHGVPCSLIKSDSIGANRNRGFQQTSVSLDFNFESDQEDKI